MKKILLIVPIIMVVLLTNWMVKNRKAPEERTEPEKARTVRYITIQETDVVPRAIGYGSVLPDKVWQVVPEVSGRILKVHENFKKGSPIKAGEILVHIDPTEYELAVAQMEADIRNLEAQISQITVQEKNSRASLGIEKKSLQLKQAEMERNRKLVEKGAVSSSQFEQAQMSYYSQQSRIQEVENALNLIPANRRALEASLALSQAKLKDARFNLERTQIKVPFNCRITDIQADTGQFVQKGQSIASADSIETAEIAARIPMDKMKNLLQSVDRKIRVTRMNMENIRDAFGLAARVRLRDGGFEADWDARFARTDATIDARTRTLGIIVAVDRPYEQVIVGERPPLVRNMFCEVEISGKPIPDSLIIPRSALHENSVYLVNAENRLERRAVTVAFAQTDFYVISDGLKPGEKLVVSDLIPAIEGMRLDPEEDKALHINLLAEAAGETAVK